MQLPPNYTFVQKEIKHARLSVNENGGVHLILPFSFSQEEVDTLLTKKKRWIEKHQRYFLKKEKIELQRNQLLLHGNRYHYFYDTEFERKIIIDHKHKTIRAKRDLLDQETQEKWYKTVAREYLQNRIEKLAGSLNFEYHRVFIRTQKTKWGNCSKEKNISLNWKLIKAPLFVIDYIIVHELVHTSIMNHSKKFWTTLKSHYPKYKSAMHWLEKYGNSL